MPPRPLCSLVLALVALGWASGEREARAHGLDAGRVTVETEDAVVRLTATPPSRAFAWADDDRDGRLGLDEVAAHRAELRAAFDRALTLRDEHGREPVCGSTDVSTPGSARGPGAVPPADHVRVARICRFATPPSGLTVITTGTLGALTVEAMRLARDADGTTRAVGTAEQALLPDTATSATLLRQPDAATEARPRSPASPRGASSRSLALAALAVGWIALRRGLRHPATPATPATRNQTPCA